MPLSDPELGESPECRVELREIDGQPSSGVAIAEELSESTPECRGELRENDGRQQTSGVAVAVLTCACISSALTSGVVFGWPSLLFLLDGDGVYRGLCEDQDKDEAITCEARDLRLAAVYSAGFFSLMASRIVFGVVLDVLGPRVASVSGISSVALGAILFAYANDESFDVFLVAFALMGFGGTGVHVSSFQLANLFPSKKRTVGASFSGTFSLSGLIFLAFRLMYSYGASREQLFCGYAVLCCGLAGAMLLYQPMRSYKLGDRLVLPARLGALVCVPAADSSTTASAAAASPVASLPLRHQLCTIEFVAIVGFFSVLFFHLQFYLGASRTLVGSLDADLAEPFLLALNIFGSLALVATPLVGWVLETKPLSFGFALALCMSFAFNILAYVPSIYMQLLTFALWSLARCAVCSHRV